MLIRLLAVHIERWSDRGSLLNDWTWNHERKFVTYLLNELTFGLLSETVLHSKFDWPSNSQNCKLGPGAGGTLDIFG